MRWLCCFGVSVQQSSLKNSSFSFAVEHVRDVNSFKLVLAKVVGVWRESLASSAVVGYVAAVKQALSATETLNLSIHASKRKQVEFLMTKVPQKWNSCIAKINSPATKSVGGEESDSKDDEVDSEDDASDASSDASFALLPCAPGPVDKITSSLPFPPGTNTGATLSNLKAGDIKKWFEKLNYQEWESSSLDCPEWFRDSFEVLANISLGLSAIRRYDSHAFSDAKKNEKDRYIREEHYQTLVTELFRFIGRALTDKGEELLFECIDARKVTLYSAPFRAVGDTDLCCVFRGGRLALMVELKLRFGNLKNFAQVCGGGHALTGGLSMGPTSKFAHSNWAMDKKNPTHRPFVFIMAPLSLTRVQFFSDTLMKRDFLPETRTLLARVRDLSVRLWTSFQSLKTQLVLEESTNDAGDAQGDEGTLGGSDSGPSTPTKKKQAGPTSDASAALSPAKAPGAGGVGAQDGTDLDSSNPVFSSGRICLAPLSLSRENVRPLTAANLLKFAEGAHLTKRQLASQVHLRMRPTII